MKLCCQSNLKKHVIKKGIYQHFKGPDKLYLVLETAKDSETMEEMVVYRHLYPEYDLFVRPLKMFLEEVDKPEYNYKGPRFKLIKEL